MRKTQLECYSGRLLNSAKHPHTQRKRRIKTVLHVAQKRVEKRGEASALSSGAKGSLPATGVKFDGQGANHAIAKAGQSSCALWRPPAAKHRCR